jgi:hypothetical protein
MATGITGGGVMAPPDVYGAGVVEWADISGMSPGRASVGGPDYGPSGQDVDYGRSRIVTQAQDLTPDAATYGNWRDLGNWQHGPVFWVLVFAILALGLVSLHVNGHVGPVRGSFGAGR